MSTLIDKPIGEPSRSDCGCSAHSIHIECSMSCRTTGCFYWWLRTQLMPIARAWEYRVVTSHIGDQRARTEETTQAGLQTTENVDAKSILDELGSEGWELVATVPALDSTWLVFKRPKFDE